DVHLQYEDALPPVVQLRDAGELVGKGTGQVTGPRLNGALRWSTFEQSQPEHCLRALAGEISTDDGAVIQFESRGFALPRTMSSRNIASAVRFVADDARYQWRRAVPAVWEGEFDAASGSARYHAYSVTNGV
ncbi:MAG TPA: hypothetical protein VFB50_01930, partial [Chloroflexota bacterium]|nr:hypothetical protein [Chloroflexota bacterium]